MWPVAFQYVKIRSLSYIWAVGSVHRVFDQRVRETADEIPVLQPDNVFGSFPLLLRGRSSPRVQLLCSRHEHAVEERRRTGALGSQAREDASSVHLPGAGGSERVSCG